MNEPSAQTSRVVRKRARLIKWSLAGNSSDIAGKKDREQREKVKVGTETGAETRSKDKAVLPYPKGKGHKINWVG